MGSRFDVFPGKNVVTPGPETSEEKQAVLIGHRRANCRWIVSLWNRNNGNDTVPNRLIVPVPHNSFDRSTTLRAAEEQFQGTLRLSIDPQTGVDNIPTAIAG